MKLKKKKHNLLKFILILIFMFFICYKTINYSYKRNTITTSRYVDYLLSNEFDKNIALNKFIKLMTNSFNPIEVLNIPDISNTSSDEYNYNELKKRSSYISLNKIEKPVVYIYNTHQLEDYKKDDSLYNITPNVMIASYILADKLNTLGIPAIVESSELVIDNNNWYASSRKLIEENINKTKSLEYFIDIHRDNISKNESTVTIRNKKYARVLFVVGLDNANYKYNLDISSKLSSLLNSKYPNISRGIITNKGSDVDGIYNQDISKNAMLIEFGGIENDIYEVINTIEVFSLIFKEFIGEFYG